MDEVDRNLLAGTGLDVVSFLIQPIILELGKGGQSSNGNPLDASRRLYAEIADSAAFSPAAVIRKNTTKGDGIN